MGDAEAANGESTPGGVNAFLAPLMALQGLLARFENRGVIIGGIAASLLGTPRLTPDLDAVLLSGVDDIPRPIREPAKEGIPPRISG